MSWSFFFKIFVVKFLYVINPIIFLAVEVFIFILGGSVLGNSEDEKTDAV